MRVLSDSSLRGRLYLDPLYDGRGTISARPDWESDETVGLRPFPASPYVSLFVSTDFVGRSLQCQCRHSIKTRAHAAETKRIRWRALAEATDGERTTGEGTRQARRPNYNDGPERLRRQLDQSVIWFDMCPPSQPRGLGAWSLHASRVTSFTSSRQGTRAHTCVPVHSQ